MAAYNAIALDRDRENLASNNGGAPSTRPGAGNNRTLTKEGGDASRPVEQTGPGQRQGTYLQHHPDRRPHELQQPARRRHRQPSAAFELRRCRDLHSEELNNLSFDLATFDRVSPRTEQSLRKFRSEYGNIGVETDHVNTAGINYQPFASLKTSLWAHPG